jgi:hypothetical protein
MEKFFIFGHARSGTTLLARLIRLHPDVHCNWQAHFFTRPPFVTSLVSDPAVASWLTRKANRWNRGGDSSPVILRAVCDFLLERDARKAGKRIVGDKSPNTHLDAEAVSRLQAIYPDARLIAIVRDGRDTVVSHRFQAFIDRPDLLNSVELAMREEYRRNHQGFGRNGRSLFTERAIRAAAAGWASNVTETDRAGRELYGSQYCSLRYEDLLADPLSQLTRLWSFLGSAGAPPGIEAMARSELAVNPDAVWQDQKERDLTLGFPRGAVGGWNAFFTDYDKRAFKEAAGKTLITWGYEKNEDW